MQVQETYEIFDNARLEFLASFLILCAITKRFFQKFAKLTQANSVP